MIRVTLLFEIFFWDTINMPKHLEKHGRLIVLVLDAVAISLAYFLAFILRFDCMNLIHSMMMGETQRGHTFGISSSPTTGLGTRSVDRNCSIIVLINIGF